MDRTKEITMLKIHILKNSRTRQFRWRAVSPNGKSIAIGGETYKTRAGCANSLFVLSRAIHTSDYEIVEPKAGRK
jgi:uncharacterized protein YegP (UPF0339 family)